MNLGRYKLNVSIAVADMTRATAFYEGSLGLAPSQEGADGSRIYETGGAGLHVYPSPSYAGQTAATLATWHVDDVEHAIDELAPRGVTFEHYEGVTTNEKGVSPRAGGGQVAWFKDPDGNTFAIESD